MIYRESGNLLEQKKQLDLENDVGADEEEKKGKEDANRQDKSEKLSQEKNSLINLRAINQSSDRPHPGRQDREKEVWNSFHNFTFNCEGLAEPSNGEAMVINAFGDENRSMMKFESPVLLSDIMKDSHEMGRGGQGWIFRFRKRSPDGLEMKVLKIYEDKEGIPSHRSIKAQFLREAEIFKLFNMSTESFTTGNQYGIVMGAGVANLRDFKLFLQQSNNRISEKEFNGLAFHMLMSCQSLNKFGYCHRDIKPENIILEPYNLFPKLIDYGLAVHVYPVEDLREHAGTRGYISPFILSKKPPFTAVDLVLADLYSLGLTLLEIVAPEFCPYKEKLSRQRWESICKDSPFNIEWLEKLLFPEREEIPTLDHVNRYITEDVGIIKRLTHQEGEVLSGYWEKFYKYLIEHNKIMEAEWPLERPLMNKNYISGDGVSYTEHIQSPFILPRDKQEELITEERFQELINEKDRVEIFYSSPQTHSYSEGITPQIHDFMTLTAENVVSLLRHSSKAMKELINITEQSYQETNISLSYHDKAFLWIYRFTNLLLDLYNSPSTLQNIALLYQKCKAFNKCCSDMYKSYVLRTEKIEPLVIEFLLLAEYLRKHPCVRSVEKKSLGYEELADILVQQISLLSDVAQGFIFCYLDPCLVPTLSFSNYKKTLTMILRKTMGYPESEEIASRMQQRFDSLVLPECVYKFANTIEYKFIISSAKELNSQLWQLYKLHLELPNDYGHILEMLSRLEGIDTLKLDFLGEQFLNENSQEMITAFSCVKLPSSYLEISMSYIHEESEIKSITELLSIQLGLQGLNFVIFLSSITDKGVKYLAESLQKLKDLTVLSINVMNCPNITDNAVFELFDAIKDHSKFKQLKFSFVECAKISEKVKVLESHFAKSELTQIGSLEWKPFFTEASEYFEDS